MADTIYATSAPTKQRHAKQSKITNTQYCCSFNQTYEIGLGYQDVDLLNTCY